MADYGISCRLVHYKLLGADYWEMDDVATDVPECKKKVVQHPRGQTFPVCPTVDVCEDEEIATHFPFSDKFSIEMH